ncbi:MAG: hypothetical protein A2W25_10135 [candidate division Zixibacteria bacterium RBG_16_53_22]|nr:MAG: hypothetical protein A2W25_10135 [candidate division Zixibacteria bacterium RBG_16_53_22]
MYCSYEKTISRIFRRGIFDAAQRGCVKVPALPEKAPPIRLLDSLPFSFFLISTHYSLFATRYECPNPALYIPVDSFEKCLPVVIGGSDLGGVGDTPVQHAGLAGLARCWSGGPDRAGLPGVVANCDNGIEILAEELVQGLGVEAIGNVTVDAEGLDGQGVDYARWFGAGRLGDILAPAELVEDSLGHDRAGRIAGADEQDAMWHEVNI